MKGKKMKVTNKKDLIVPLTVLSLFVLCIVGNIIYTKVNKKTERNYSQYYSTNVSKFVMCVDGENFVSYFNNQYTQQKYFVPEINKEVVISPRQTIYLKYFPQVNKYVKLNYFKWTNWIRGES
jgi:hypothetical protein